MAMQTSVVPPNHQYMMKKKALEEQLMEQYKDALESADRKQRKAILKEIEQKVAKALKASIGNARFPTGVIF
jgi:hypothetical protein